MIKKLWDYLDGKKTKIGVAILFIAYGLNGIQAVDENTYQVMINVGNTVMAFGLGAGALKALKR